MDLLRKASLVLVVLVVGLVLLVSLPSIAYWLLLFLLGSGGAFFFFPGLLLYLLLVCVPLGLAQWARKAAGRPSGPLRLPSAGWLAIGAAGAIVGGLHRVWIWRNLG
jgi:hypothetical protein